MAHFLFDYKLKNVLASPTKHSTVGINKNLILGTTKAVKNLFESEKEEGGIFFYCI